jgi:single-strand selective monofunctional uracil DNA glycosylase
MDLMRISRRLAKETRALRFAPPVAHVLRPLVHARVPHERYLRRHARRGVECLLVGMNPGPFGMAQTGVPFGDVEMVRGWLGIEGPVRAPRRQHPRRPVLGFASTRREVSGTRFWGWARDRFVTPERFFARFFVANYCPLGFVEASGRNRTPDRLARGEREALFAACDRALRDTVLWLRPRVVVGVGRFAAARCERALAGLGVPVHEAPHPSPASPAANRGWAGRMTRRLEALGIPTS